MASLNHQINLGVLEKSNFMVKKFHCWEKDGHGIVNYEKVLKDLVMYISMRLLENLE